MNTKRNAAARRPSKPRIRSLEWGYPVPSAFCPGGIGEKSPFIDSATAVRSGLCLVKEMSRRRMTGMQRPIQMHTIWVTYQLDPNTEAEERNALPPTGF